MGRGMNVLKKIMISWFRLNADEQKALGLILFIFMVGLLVRLWRMMQ